MNTILILNNLKFQRFLVILSLRTQDFRKGGGEVTKKVFMQDLPVFLARFR